MKTILLARVSTEDQETIQQIEKLKEYIKSKGRFDIKNTEIFDFDESAYKDVGQRKEFQKVLASLFREKDKVALVCDKVDRMTRDFLTFLPIIDKLRRNEKIELHFPGDNLILTNESPAGDLFRFNMGVALAQYYSDSISDGVIRKIAQKIRNGEILSKVPYGYKNITYEDGTKGVEVDAYEAVIVLKLFEWYATDSYSMNELIIKIKKEFNINIAKSKLAEILQNKFYIGINTYKKKNLEYNHKYPTIVTTHLFEKVQNIKLQKLQWNGKGKYAGKPFFYRNLIKCDICGYSLSPEEQRSKSYYCCTEYGGKHGAKYVSEKALDEQFEKVFDKLVLTEDTADRLIQELRKVNESNSEISEKLINQFLIEKSQYKKRKSKLYDDYAVGSITSDFYEEKLKQYDSKIDEIDETLKRVEKVDKSFYFTAGLIIQLSQHATELFKRSKLEERRLLINSLLTNITWDGEKLHYEYLSPFDLIVELNTSTVWGGWRDSNPRPPLPQRGALTS